MKLTNHPRLRTALGAALLLAANTVSIAQTVQPVVPFADKDEEAVRLNAFVISTDRDSGWVAATTLIGSRTNEELANLPMSVDAITSDFMRDLSAYTLEDTARFVAGLDVTSTLERRTDDNMVAYRGMQIGNYETAQASRNFFLWYRSIQRGRAE